MQINLLTDNMVHPAFKSALGAILFLILSFTGVSQSSEKSTLKFDDPTNNKNSFVDFFANRFNVNLILKPSITLFVFQVHRDGHIDNIKNWGTLEKDVEQEVSRIILKSEPCWRFSSNSEEYKWVIFPFFNGNPYELKGEDGRFLQRSLFEQFSLVTRFLGTDFSSVYFSPPKTIFSLFLEAVL